MNATLQDDSSFQNETLEIPFDELLESTTLSTEQSTLQTLPDPGYENTITMTVSQQGSASVRKFKPARFAMGLLCTTCGMAMILGIGIRVIEMRQLGDDLAMPVVAVCVIIGIVLLCGGFGIMTTSSSGFDEAEFDRLAAAGNISAVSNARRDDIAHGENDNRDQPNKAAA